MPLGNGGHLGFKVTENDCVMILGNGGHLGFKVSGNDWIYKTEVAMFVNVGQDICGNNNGETLLKQTPELWGLSLTYESIDTRLCDRDRT